jgi:hypothetical protein
VLVPEGPLCLRTTCKYFYAYYPAAQWTPRDAVIRLAGSSGDPFDTYAMLAREFKWPDDSASLVACLGSAGNKELMAHIPLYDNFPVNVFITCAKYGFVGAIEWLAKSVCFITREQALAMALRHGKRDFFTALSIIQPLAPFVIEMLLREAADLMDLAYWNTILEMCPIELPFYRIKELVMPVFGSAKSTAAVVAFLDAVMPAEWANMSFKVECLCSWYKMRGTDHGCDVLFSPDMPGFAELLANQNLVDMFYRDLSLPRQTFVIRHGARPRAKDIFQRIRYIPLHSVFYEGPIDQIYDALGPFIMQVLAAGYKPVWNDLYNFRPPIVDALPTDVFDALFAHFDTVSWPDIADFFGHIGRRGASALMARIPNPDDDRDTFAMIFTPPRSQFDTDALNWYRSVCNN